jgi:tetratricopeptide (TPR) repeat protein
MADFHFAEALAIYSKIGDRVTVARIRSNLAVMHLHAGQYNQCLEQAEQALVFFEKLQQPYWIALNTSNIAEANLGLNELERAEHFAILSLREEEASLRPYALTTLGRVFLARGESGESERYLREAIATAQEAQDKWAEAPAWRALAITLRKIGQHPAATEALQTALSLYEEMKLGKEVERTRTILNSEL